MRRCARVAAVPSIQRAFIGMSRGFSATNKVTASDSELGKATTYEALYNPKLLFPIPRQGKRDEIDILPGTLPFGGHDVWNAYEMSWLTPKGKPEVAIGVFTVPCTSPNIVESKSFKLYLNSLNNTRYGSKDEVQKALAADLSSAAGGPVIVKLDMLHELAAAGPVPIGGGFEGTSLDVLDVECTDYTVNPALLQLDADPRPVTESVCSDLLKSNCLVTGQPDWGSVGITYTGRRMDHSALLRYLVSFRDHNEFHEQCVERIFTDIMKHCKPDHLTVEARYTRRGGLDINPLRSTVREPLDSFHRLVRQ